MKAIEDTRLKLAKSTSAHKKSNLGQFLTPSRVAKFMAGLFYESHEKDIRLLDPGAGIGSLSSSFLERCFSGGLNFESIKITAYEIDDHLHQHLRITLDEFQESGKITYSIVGNDFIEAVVKEAIKSPVFTHAILNPPYKKINNNSPHRHLLREVGIETVNLYSAFLALSIALVRRGGQVVAIIPRSFCNGPYYKPFREFMLQRATIKQLHLFDSRNTAFKDDDVLQENVIIHLEVGGKQGPVKVSTSTDDTFEDFSTAKHPFERIVFPDDVEKFIHVPTSTALTALESSEAVQFTLSAIGLKVSTGPVVDFRMKDHLRAMPGSGTVPLLYPSHFRGLKTVWPIPDQKKPNALVRNEETEKWLSPNGFYCIVRRFSSKEEKRRIVASVVRPDQFGKVDFLGFENHLNFYHEDKRGLPEELAYGIAAYLNTSAVDEHFRRFNGHTQVNATDLKLIKYPSRKSLTSLGRKVLKRKTDLIQKDFDEHFATLES